MIDLTNRKIKDLNAEELEILRNLIEKYDDLLKYIHHTYAYEFVYVLHLGIEHINQNHSNLPTDWKAWSMVLLKNMVENKLNTQNITAVIDEFVDYYNTEYNDYCKDIISVNDFERDRGFVYKFLHKKQ